MFVCIIVSYLLPCLQKLKICIVSCGIFHVIIAVSCVLTYIIVFQMAIKNWTENKELNYKLYSDL